jgi:hypothetical protein
MSKKLFEKKKIIKIKKKLLNGAMYFFTDVCTERGTGRAAPSV